MGPKSASKKTETKKADKVIEDKTFGLKNKKGAKTQKYVKMVEQQVKQKGMSAQKLARMQEPSRKDKKDAEQAKLEELKELFKPVVDKKVMSADDPKSIICSYFKQGLCTRGNKCKFSHDMSSAAAAGERKSEKKNLYADERGEMDDWDEEELRNVVEKKHGEHERAMPKTNIVCKHFLDAVEAKKYGWFWECPNGNDKCHYKHALPPGFVLKSEKKAKKNEGDELTLEDLIEKERAALPSDRQTKVTLESFMAWKERKKNEKLAALEESSSKKKDNFKTGNMAGLSGRDLFSFNPELAQGDENDEDGGEIVMYHDDSDDDQDDESENLARKVEEVVTID